MGLPTTPIVFQEPPEEYSQQYMTDMIKQIELFQQRLNANGYVRASTVNISDLPTAATGLRTGDLWNDTGTVKIV